MAKPLIMYHPATHLVYHMFTQENTWNGGIFLYPYEEAVARLTEARPYLLKCQFTLYHPRRTRDNGADWLKRISSANRSGNDGLAYVLRKQEPQYMMMSDKEYLAHVPDAPMCYILLDLHQITVLDSEVRQVS
jgi:hypothetical protein